MKYGGLRYLEAAHVKDFLSLLRLVANPRDELSWFRVLQLLEGVGPVRARRVVDAPRRATTCRGAGSPPRCSTSATRCPRPCASRP